MRRKDLSAALNLICTLLLIAPLFPWGTSIHAQWLEGYSRRARITVDEGLVPGGTPLAGFPLLFSYTDTMIRSTSHGGYVSFTNGLDICFTDQDSVTVLDYEIENYDPETGSLSAWIRIPSLSADSSTELFLYYGNPDGLPLWDTTGVWSSQYIAVWHMEDDPSDDQPQITDATSFLNHGTTGGSMTGDDQVEGKISGGIQFDGVDDYVTMPVSGFNTEEGSVELWIYLDSMPESGSDYFFAHRQEDPITDRVYLRVWPDGEWGSGMGDTYDLVRGDTLETGAWHHLALTWNGTEIFSFLDGAQDFGPVSYAGLDTVREIYVMTWMPSSESASGTLDELRVSAIARDSAWIAASYSNQNQPEFYYHVNALPVNDFPCDAIQLDISDSCMFSIHSNMGAGNSGIADPGCGTYEGGDIWFYVKIPPSGSFQIQTDTEAEAQFPDNDGWMYRAAMALYTGNCDSLVMLDCYENNSIHHPRMAGAIVSGQTPGDTVWVRIWENSNNDNGMFRICVTVPDTTEETCPQPFQVSGGGSYFVGDTGIAVYLSGSETGVDYTLLLNDTTRLDTLTGDGNSLTWTPITMGGIYKIEAISIPDSCRVMMIDSAIVTVIEETCPSPFQVSGGGSYCVGDTGVALILSGSETGVDYTLLLNDTTRLDTLPGNGNSLTWSPLTMGGVYKIEGFYIPDSCKVMMTDSAMVIVTEPPQGSADALSVTCFGDNDGSILLEVDAGSPFTVHWSGQGGFTSSEQNPANLAPGAYRATVTDSNHCEFVTGAITITEPPLLVATVDHITHLTSYEANDGAVSLSVTGGTIPYGFSWTGTDGYLSSQKEPSEMTVGYYDVVVTDDHLCVDSIRMIMVSVEEDADAVFIPEGFSPNGDGKNDLFVILGIEQFPGNELVVFNRQGVEVFRRTGYENDWDGTPEKGGVLGGVLPEGTYYYVFTYGASGIKKGYVYINRE